MKCSGAGTFCIHFTNGCETKFAPPFEALNFCLKSTHLAGESQSDAIHRHPVLTYARGTRAGLGLKTFTPVVPAVLNGRIIGPPES